MTSPRPVIATALAAALALCLAGGARAQTAPDDTLLTGTLATIRERGTVLIGHRDSAPPFSFLNKAGQPVGFSLDLCHGIAADIAAALNLDLLEPDAPAWQRGVRIAYVSLAADARLPAVTSGAVDLECGSTTATEERARSVAFSPVFFLAGTKLMVAAGSAVAGRADLGGKTVVAGAGTTNATVMRALAAQAPAFTVQEAPSLGAAFDTLAAGRADAFASDDVLLSGLIATRPDGRRFRVVGDFLSFEPYAITLRRDDPAFQVLVRQGMERMAREGTLTALYGRWLQGRLPTGEVLDVPISPQLVEIYRSLGSPD